MSSSKERVFVTGASGNIGTGVVRGLVEKGVLTTAYVRDEKKGKDLFANELKTGLLKLVVGTYSSVDVFTKAIHGHTRLFLLYAAHGGKPTDMSQVKGSLAKVAFEQGVRQIVDLSSAFVSSYGRKGLIGYAHTTAEEKLWTLADEKPDQRSLVVLRPGQFMSNHLMADVHHIKRSNKIVYCGSPSSVATWIDTKGEQKKRLYS
jgi:NAD(P)-dependent dehydrogenase (short-subunit alcohol dehydrogenase family)